MIFKRRVALSWFGKVKSFFAPQKGWRRGFSYIGRRVQRLPDTPHRIALGFACGVFVSFTPFFTMHFVAGALCALIVRGNVLASALGTFFGNPVTFPVIAGVSLTLGKEILGAGADPRRFSISMVFENFPLFLDHVFWPYLVGGIGPGLVTAAIFYWLLRPLVAAYQNRRRGRLAAAAAARVKAHLARASGIAPLAERAKLGRERS